MSFRFRLASVLRHRRRLEDERALALARERGHEAMAEETLARAQQGARGARATLADAAFIGTTGAALAELALGVDDASRRLGRAAHDLAAAQTQSEAARVELVDAARARRTLERLEELQRTAYRRAADAREQRVIDEVAALSHREQSPDEEASR